MSKALRAYSRAINRWRDKKLRQGFTYQGHVWDSDDEALRNLTEAVAGVAAGLTLPQDFSWRTKNNEDVPADQALLRGMAGAWRERKFAIYKVSWQAKEDLKSQNPDEVLASLDQRLEDLLNA
jgi:hypothetical protein